jgi:hypothetical protein
MPRKLPSRDPIGNEIRRSRAERRVGFDSRCELCGESRPEALIEGSDPMICAECSRKQRGHSVLDGHHPAAKSNHELEIPVPVNDHRAILTPAMYDWPKETRENPHGSPLLAAAGCIRGFCDTVIYLIEELLFWIADLLEYLHAWLTEKFGERYWIAWDLNQITRKQ